MKKIHYLFLCSLIMCLAACEKYTMPMQFAPKVTTGNATEIYRKGCILSGSIQFIGTSTAKEYGILFSESESMADCTQYPVTDKNTDFSIQISNLSPNTTYYYCAYANSSYTILKGQILNFTTPKSNEPIFADIVLGKKDEFSCEVSVMVLDEGGSEISLSGFCWSKVGESEPTTDSSVINTHINDGSISAIITGLEPNTEYQIRAYATNSDGIGYSKIFKVKTEEAKAPTLSTITQKAATDFSVTIEAKVTDAGTSAISKAGFCWSTTKQTPTTEDESNDLTSQLTDENTTLHSEMSELTPGTTYYIRAYATNEQGTAYSEVFTFNTAQTKAPTLSTITQKAATDFSVTIEAKVTDAGTSAISKAGFCWSTTKQTPTTEDESNDLTSQLTDENTTLHSEMSELTPGTTYYIRAYATNKQGTSYSEVFTYKTPYKDTDNGNTGLNNLPTTKWE